MIFLDFLSFFYFCIQKEIINIKNTFLKKFVPSSPLPPGSVTFKNDIALLHLSEALDFSSPRVQPVCLSRDPKAVNRLPNVTVIGWGHMSEGETVKIYPIIPLEKKDVGDFC